jgi:hypothetical protein
MSRHKEKYAIVPVPIPLEVSAAQINVRSIWES